MNNNSNNNYISLNPARKAIFCGQKAKNVRMGSQPGGWGGVKRS